MPSDSTGRNDPDEQDVSGGYRAIVERYQNASNQCTIFPADADRTEQMTAWITAKSPSYVDLREYR